MKTSNFTFLDSFLIHASNYAKSAEEFYRQKDYKHCATDMRLFLEAILDYLKVSEGITYGKGKNLEAIDNLEKRRILQYDTVRWMHNIRIFGKKGAHHDTKEPTETEALVALEQAFKVGRFFYNRSRHENFYGDFDARILQKKSIETANEYTAISRSLSKHNPNKSIINKILPLMTKQLASEIINRSLNENVLNPKNGGNVSWANINASKKVWWINIPFNKFTSDRHLILNDEDKKVFYWLKIDANYFENPRDCFRDKKGQADLELSAESEYFLIDIKSGGSQFYFNDFVIKLFQYQ